MSDRNEHSYLQGKRYIALARCSTLGQADTSIGDQLNLLRQFADRRGMIRVDDLILEGVSGSLPGGRSDIDQLIARKETRNDFEVLLVQDASHLTRGGSRHGASIEWSFQKVGIEIVFAVGDYPEGAAGDVLKTLNYYTAQEHARSIAMTSARGSMSSLESEVCDPQLRRRHAGQARSANGTGSGAVWVQQPDGGEIALHQAER